MITNHGEAAWVSTRLTAAGQSGSELVGPSRFVRVAMAPMTKLLNPLIRKLAGRRHFRMAGLITHVGRRSGRRYVTPAGARLHGDTVVIPLTFGSRSDWSRNVRAAGGCSIRLDGRDLQAVRPEVMSAEEARPVVGAAFSPAERATFRMLGIKQFMVLQVAAD